MNADLKTADSGSEEISQRRALWINKARFRRAPRPELSDTLLTTLTILLTILMFVVAPLQASGVVTGRYFGLLFAATLIPAAFMLAANWLAAGSIIISIILLACASEMEFRQATTVDTFLDAMAWLIAGIALIAVVSRAVFGPGKVTFHLCHCRELDLFQLCYLERGWLWRHCPLAPLCTGACQPGGGHRPTLSRNSVGPSGVPADYRRQRTWRRQTGFAHVIFRSLSPMPTQLTPAKTRSMPRNSPRM